jgi:hypothetical protein
LELVRQLIIDGDEILVVEEDELLLLLLRKLSPKIIGIGIHIMILDLFDSVVLLLLFFIGRELQYSKSRFCIFSTYCNLMTRWNDSSLFYSIAWYILESLGLWLEAAYSFSSIISMENSYDADICLY